MQAPVVALTAASISHNFSSNRVLNSFAALALFETCDTTLLTRAFASLVNALNVRGEESCHTYLHCRARQENKMFADRVRRCRSRVSFIFRCTALVTWVVPVVIHIAVSIIMRVLTETDWVLNTLHVDAPILILKRPWQFEQRNSSGLICQRPAKMKVTVVRLTRQAPNVSANARCRTSHACQTFGLMH